MKIRILALAVAAFLSVGAGDVVPQDYYGKIASRVAGMLPRFHVLQKPMADDVSRQAWTNLIQYYDYNRAVFLQSDLDRFAPMQTGIANALREGDVSFAYTVNGVFLERLRECVDYATNLLAKTEFDFSQQESYTIKRDKAIWPKTRAEREDLWRRRLKNELLVQVLSRELDAEEEKSEKGQRKAAKKAAKKAAREQEKLNLEVKLEGKTQGNKAQTKAATNDVAKAESPTNAVEAVENKPEPTPKENLINRYKHYLQIAQTEVDDEAVLQRYMSAVAQAYDPHTDYMAPMRKEDFDMDMNLQLFGVGAVLSMSFDDGALEIQEVMKGGPMDREGSIKTGAHIVGVGQGNGPVENTTWKPMRKTIKKIRGPKDTKVVLEVTDKNGENRRRVALIRDVIKLEEQAATGRVETVTSETLPVRLGYVHLPSFYGTMDKKPNDPDYRSCSLDVARYISRFTESGQETAGMILDLRGNGGGSLREAVLLTQLFVRPTPVVQIRETRQVYALPTFPDQPTLAYDKPLVVMVDRASASASEIVAAALRDLGRCVVVGDTQTHGKGTVQTVLPMGGEKFGSMKITTARFYRINGSSTQVKGVASDIVLPSTLDGLDIGEDKLPNALPWSRIEPAGYVRLWNLDSYIPELKSRSEARRAKLDAWKRHLEAVNLFRKSADREVVPLERGARLAMMRADRKLNDLEDVDDEDDDEETISRRRRKNKDKKNDLVLDEAFQILSDLVRMTNGEGIPPPAEDRTPAWLKALGGE